MFFRSFYCHLILTNFRSRHPRFGAYILLFLTLKVYINQQHFILHERGENDTILMANYEIRSVFVT